jgi:cytochrome c oxidase subunit 1/cytochrome c oxidase subunit I+III
VLLGINVFPVIGGLYYWYPKLTGRLMDEHLGRLGFWISFVGFNVAFFPMHLSGLLGMPRRVYTYPENVGWDVTNMITSIGSFIFAAGVLVTLWNLVISRHRGAVAAANPWDAATLEWSVPSPPPAFNFRRIPEIASRHPLWEAQLNESVQRSRLDTDLVLDHGRETLATTALDAEADAILKMPGDSLVPLWLSLALLLMFAAALGHAWWVAAAALAGGVIATSVWLAPLPAPSPVEEPVHG